MTLKELIEKHGLPVKVQEEVWNTEYFEIVATRGGRCIGYYDDGDPADYYDTSDLNWRLYTKPKTTKKVKMYMPVFRDGSGTFAGSLLWESFEGMQNAHRVIGYSEIDVEVFE